MIVDKKKGNILAQGDDQEDSNLLTNLTLSTVKECDIDEADRNFCFQVRRCCSILPRLSLFHTCPFFIIFSFSYLSLFHTCPFFILGPFSYLSLFILVPFSYLSLLHTCPFFILVPFHTCPFFILVPFSYLSLFHTCPFFILVPFSYLYCSETMVVTWGRGERWTPPVIVTNCDVGHSCPRSFTPDCRRLHPPSQGNSHVSAPAQEDDRLLTDHSIYRPFRKFCT